MLTLLADPYSRRYVAPLGSPAGVLFLAVVVGALVLPFVVAFASGGFWLKESSFLEQPSVRFQRSLVAYFEGLYANGSHFYLTWATDPEYNRLFGTNTRIPIFKVREVDGNSDGTNDYLKYSLTLPLQSGESIRAVRLGLFFQYELKSRILMNMQTAAFIQQASQFPAAKLTVHGDLQLRQRGPVPALAGSRRTVYDTAVFNATALANGGFWSWLMDYEARNETTTFACAYPLWESSPGAHEAFEIDGLIRYPVQRIYYQPDLPELLKFGWIQYVCTLIPVGGVLFGLLGFVIKARVVPTHIELDRVPTAAVATKSGYKPYHF